MLIKKPILVVIALGAILSIVFTNCSEVAFEMDSKASAERMLNAHGGLVINGGAEFTNQKTVDLAIESGSDEMYVTEDPTCQSGGTWEPYSSQKSWPLTTNNQKIQVFVKFRDSTSTGYESSCRGDDIVHDDIAPSRSMTKEPGRYVTASADMAWVASDSGSGLLKANCWVDDDGPLKCDSSYSRPDLEEGPHMYAVVAWDRAGNAAPPAETGFIVDRSKPVLTLSLTPPKISGVTTSNFEFAATDKYSGIEDYECRSASSAPWHSCTSPAVITAANGENHIWIRAKDGAGNLSDESQYTWNVDLTAPSVEITKYPLAYSADPSPSFEFRSADPTDTLVKYECSLDSAAFAVCTSPHMTTTLAEGTHTFAVRGFDQVGNVSSPTMKTWIVDTTKPVVTITQDPGALTSLTTASYNFVATDSVGVETTECSVDGGAYAKCTAPKTLMNLTEGPHSFAVRAIDKAGNVSSPALHSLTVDTTKPVVTITSAPLAQSKEAIAHFEFTATDAAPGAIDRTECHVDGANYDVCTSPQEIADLEDGQHTYYVRAIDKAGNTSDVKSHSWLKDTTPPAINFGLQPSSVIGMGTPSVVQFTVADLGVGIDTITCGLDDVIATCTAMTYTFNQIAAGMHKFTVIAKDKLGNESRNEATWKVELQMQNYTQDFTVTANNNKVDVLVVVDNSGSMETEQKNMAERFSGFIDQLAGLDWQVAITTTAVESCDDCTNTLDGKLKKLADANPDVYIINSKMPIATAKTYFADNVQMSGKASGQEQGIRATYRSIERYIAGAASNASNSDKRVRQLYRDGAALAVLVVTDADETNTSGTLVSNTPDGLIDKVSSTWDGRKTFSFHSIIVKPDDVDCLGRDGNEGYGYAYDTLSKRTGGVVGTVCSSDYTSQLTSIGRSTAELSRSVTLSCEPLDTSGDGKPDVVITTATTSGVSTPPTGGSSYTVSGLKVTFDMALPADSYRLSYTCLKQ